MNKTILALFLGLAVAEDAGDKTPGKKVELPGGLTDPCAKPEQLYTSSGGYIINTRLGKHVGGHCKTNADCNKFASCASVEFNMSYGVFENTNNVWEKAEAGFESIMGAFCITQKDVDTYVQNAAWPKDKKVQMMMLNAQATQTTKERSICTWTDNCGDKTVSEMKNFGITTVCQSATQTKEQSDAALKASLEKIQAKIDTFKLPDTDSKADMAALVILQMPGGVVASAAAVEARVTVAANAALDKRIAAKKTADAEKVKADAQLKAVQELALANCKKEHTDLTTDKAVACLNSAKFAGITCKDLKDMEKKKACDFANQNGQALVATVVTLISVAALF